MPTPPRAAPDDTCGLVQAAQGGDRTAFAQLYTAFARVVHGLALASCGSREAEDVTQEVFVKAFAQLGTLRDPAAFPAWLGTLARSTAIDRQRQRQRQRTTSLAEEPLGREPRPDTNLEQRDASAAALACIRRLPDTYRDTLLLRLVEGLSGPEIAARTGMTHGSVRVNLTRGMALLRPLLAQEGLP
ncbi:MAG: sigma-70 family RNA polymerase sigma factor [Planctomycetes bacterium]|nr:sigma-70 family RNA polymerase sigma factor [Planctomycetota bacterium]